MAKNDPWTRTYPNTEKGAIECLKDLSVFDCSNATAVNDSWYSNVWLVSGISLDGDTTSFDNEPLQPIVYLAGQNGRKTNDLEDNS